MSSEPNLCSPLEYDAALAQAIDAAVGSGIEAIDASARKVHANDAFCRMVGWSREELIGAKPPFIYWPEEEHERIHAALQLGLEGRFPREGVQLTFRRRNGERFPVLLLVAPLRKEGEVRGWVANIVDLSAHHPQADALQKSERMFRDLAEHIEEVFYVFDPVTAQMTYISPSYERIWGRSCADLYARPLSFLEAIVPDDRDRMQANMAAHVEGITTRDEYRIIRPDGSEAWIWDQSFPLRDDHGAISRVVGIASDITERKQYALALERANRALQTLGACNHELVLATAEAELLDAICRTAVQSGGYLMAWVGFAEHDPAKSVRPVARYGRDEGYLDSVHISWADNEYGRGPTGTAIRAGVTQVNQNIRSNPRMAPWRWAASERGFSASIALPLKDVSGTLGALMLYAAEPNAFDERETRLLEDLAEALTFGIRTLRTRAERDRIAHEQQHHDEILRKSLQDAVAALATTVEMRDPYIAGHHRRVAALAVAIASELGLSEERTQGLKLAALVHDIGNIHVPAEVLAEPGRLGALEFELAKGHSDMGHEMLKDIRFAWPIADIVWQHHERLDGSGYPRGLKGDEISFEARILAVAEVIEAITSHRPHRAALGIDTAMHVITAGRGEKFDAAVVDACLRLFKEKGLTLPV